MTKPSDPEPHFWRWASLGAVLAAAVMVVNAIVLVDLWGWFVAPLGVPAISAWHAYGLTLVVSWFKTKPAAREIMRPKKREPGETPMQDNALYALASLVTAPLTWTIGYGVHEMVVR